MIPFVKIDGNYDEVVSAVYSIGKFVAIAKNCFFHAPDNHACVIEGYRNSVSCYDFGFPYTGHQETGIAEGLTTIGNDVWIGTGVCVLSGVHIGDGAIVGAHAVVAKDVPPYAVVVGNPARIVHYRFPPDVIKKLLKIKWWDLKYDKIKEIFHLMKDVNTLIEYYEKNPNQFRSD